MAKNYGQTNLMKFKEAEERRQQRRESNNNFFSKLMSGSRKHTESKKYNMSANMDKRAAEIAGYAKHSYPKVVRNLKKEITELAENHLATHSAKAATRLTDLLDEDGTTPHANIRLAAATQLLDRVGIVKKDQLDINMKAMHGIFILPAKDGQDQENN